MAQHQRAGVQDPLDKVEKVMRISGEADERDNPGHEREAGEDSSGHSPAGARRLNKPRAK